MYKRQISEGFLLFLPLWPGSKAIVSPSSASAVADGLGEPEPTVSPATGVATGAEVAGAVGVCADWLLQPLSSRPALSSTADTGPVVPAKGGENITRPA